MVNSGPLRICEIFLSPEFIQSNPEDVNNIRELIDAMRDFIKKCQFAVLLNEHQTEGDEKFTKFSAMIGSHFKELKNTILGACVTAENILESQRK